MKGQPNEDAHITYQHHLQPCHTHYHNTLHNTPLISSHYPETVNFIRLTSQLLY